MSPTNKCNILPTYDRTFCGRNGPETEDESYDTPGRTAKKEKRSTRLLCYGACGELL